MEKGHLARNTTHEHVLVHVRGVLAEGLKQVPETQSTSCADAPDPPELISASLLPLLQLPPTALWQMRADKESRQPKPDLQRIWGEGGFA